MEIYAFGHFQLNVTERCLYYEGEIVPLSAKLFDILLLFVRNSGNLISKEHLMKTIWADTTVEENNLTVSISYLRKLLDVGEKAHSYIQTVSGYGYRFAAKVEIVNPPEVNQSAIKSTRHAAFNKAETAISSLAVLLLENVNEDSQLEYLTDGITESIIYNLSNLPRLKIMARNTVFRYKGKEIDARKIGHDLGVGAVLTGRVIREDDNLIIKIELVDVDDGAQIWGEKYNRQIRNILDLQEEVARTISEKLRLKLSAEEKRILSKRYTNNTEAYQHYLKGRYFWNKYTEEGLTKSVKYFQQAIDIDSNYALAYAGLSDSYFRLSNIYISPKKALPQSKAMAIKALEIDPELSEAYMSLGLVKFYYDHDWKGAEAAYEQAIKINPSLPLIHQRYGTFLMLLSRFDEAVAEFKLCCELDPLSLHHNVGFAICLAIMGRYDQAIAQIQTTINLEPHYYPGQMSLGFIYLYKGAYQEAIEKLNNSLQIEENNNVLGYLGYTYAVSGQRQEAEEILEQLKKRSSQKYISPYYSAIIYAGLGKKEKAFEHLEKLFDEHSDWLVWLNVAPELKSLRSDERFTNLLKRVNLL